MDLGLWFFFFFVWCKLVTQFYSLAYWHLVAPAPFVEKIENERVNGSVVSDSSWPPWTKTRQAPLSVGLSRQEYWSGLPCPSPGDLPNLHLLCLLHCWQAGSLSLAPPGKPLKKLLFPNWSILEPLSICKV